MAVVAVTFNGTRVNASDTNTNWGNWGSSGGSPAAESPIAYQNALAVNKKINSTTLGGIDYDPGAGAIDMTGATYPLWFVKAIASDSFDLNTTYGMNVGIGSGLTAMYEYNIAGSGANNPAYTTYRPQGGYLITAIDPNIAAWRENTTGSPDLTAVDWFGLQAAFIVGAAKAENLALDAIDLGTGLTLTAGTGADPVGTFKSFVAWDQDITTNRYGVVIGAGDAVRAIGLLTIGSATATEFLDDDSVVTFPDGYHSAGLFGVYADIQNASTVIEINSLLISEGTVQTLAADDTRADFTVSGTSGSFDLGGQLRNFRNVTFTSVCDVLGADFECELLTQASANISETTIRTNAQTSIACLQDPTFGTTTDLHDTDFIQTGVGHAIEIDTAGDYTFTNLTFTGYGADTTDSAALDVTASTGTVNIYTTTAVTYKTAGATVNIIINPVTTTITCEDIGTGLAIQGVAVTLRATDGTGDLPFEDSVTITQTAGVATVSHTAHGLSTGHKVEIEGADQNEYNRIKTITVTGANSYTFTVPTGTTSPATGTITSTGVLIDALTDVNGEVSDTRTLTLDQPIDGHAAKGSSAPAYKRQPISGVVDSSTGVSITTLMIPD